MADENRMLSFLLQKNAHTLLTCCQDIVREKSLEGNKKPGKGASSFRGESDK